MIGHSGTKQALSWVRGGGGGGGGGGIQCTVDPDLDPAFGVT